MNSLYWVALFGPILLLIGALGIAGWWVDR